MKRRVLAFLAQGLTPEKLALCVTLGLVVGVIPVLGSTTILLAAIALLFRLNLPAIQSVNWIVYPLQLALLIPFYRLGEWLFGVPPLPISLDTVKALADAGVLHTIEVLWDTTMRALAAWMLTGLAAGTLLYAAILRLFRLWQHGRLGHHP